MKEFSRRAANQTEEDFLTSREDLRFRDDGSLSDSAFQSDFSNGSVPDLAKSPFSGDAALYERNSTQEWRDDLSPQFTDSCSTSGHLVWSEGQSTSNSNTRECNEERCSRDLVPQSKIERLPSNFEGRKIYRERVSSWCTVSPDFSGCNASDEDAYVQHSEFSRGAQQSDGVIRELHGARYLGWNFTQETLSPITEGLGQEEFECYESDNGISDVDSEESEALWSPSSEDVPLVRPDFVPRLDLSWVFEDEKCKQKRSEKRGAAQRRAPNGRPEMNAALCVKLLKTSTSPDTWKVAENGSRKDKAFSKCYEELSHGTWEQNQLQDKSTDVTQYHQRNNSADQTLAHEPRPQQGSDNIVNQVVSACVHDNAQMTHSSETSERTAWLPVAGKQEKLSQQQSRRSLTDRSWPRENLNPEPYFDAFVSEATHPKAKCFSCPERRESYEEIAESSLCFGDANQQVCPDQVSSSCNQADQATDLDSYPQVRQIAKYYVVDERRDPQLLSEMRQRCWISQNEQKTEARAIQSHTMSETNRYDSGIYGLTYDPPPKSDLHFISGQTSDMEPDAATNSKSKLVQFIERNAETTESDRQEELEGERDGQNVRTDEPRSEELYDVEATVLRSGRRQKLAKFVCFFIGCQFTCCQQSRCQPCYCDWKCDLKCFR